ncbi:MAG: hypothetical protein J1F18_03545 [Lachnospiraceae bacterium]|nr:hypothetical protein [Lachnospiraceae bacterium]
MTYYTDYSIEDCIGLLSRKNIYDVFEYSFEMKTETAGKIRFIHCNKHPLLGRAFIKAVYTIEFKKSNKTIIDIELAYGALSILPQKWITEFMEQKLDAVEIIEEDNIST